jgi:hypothetical protein
LLDRIWPVRVGSNLKQPRDCSIGSGWTPAATRDLTRCTRAGSANLQNPIYKLQPIYSNLQIAAKLQPIYSNLFDLTTARMMNNQQINLAVSNPVI